MVQPPYSFSRKRTKLIAAGILAAIFLSAGVTFYRFDLRSSTSPKLAQQVVPLEVVRKGATNGTPVPSINSQVSQVTTTPSTTISQTPTTTPTISDSNGIETYSDAKVTFHHLVKDNYYTYGTKVDGNRIYVYPTYLSSYKLGSFIELFKKDPNDTIQQAIQKNVLTGYNIADCPIGDPYTVGQLPSNMTGATIRYNANNLMLGAPEPKDETKCPYDYTATEGAKYFAVDTKHPDLLIFYSVSNGLYPADSTGNTLWFQTLTFNY
jgi:hypothetical protein